MNRLLFFEELYTFFYLNRLINRKERAMEYEKVIIAGNFVQLEKIPEILKHLSLDNHLYTDFAIALLNNKFTAITMTAPIRVANTRSNRMINWNGLPASMIKIMSGIMVAEYTR